MDGGLRTQNIFKRSTQELPLVSIVTVVFNGERYLEQTIQSVLNQTHKNIEYIIIDGGSSDRTLEIIADYENKIDYWVSETDKGIYDAMNKGIRFARGELIALLNADDFYEPYAVEMVVDKFRSNAVAQIIFGHALIMNKDLNIRYKFEGHLKYWRGMCFSHQAMFAHKDIYRTIGMYDSNLLLAADYDFVIRALNQGTQFSHVDAVLVNYRATGLSSRSQIAAMIEWRKVIIRYVTTFNWRHIYLILLLIKSLLLVCMFRGLERIFGPQLTNKLSSFYYKNFIAKDFQSLKQ